MHPSRNAYRNKPIDFAKYLATANTNDGRFQTSLLVSLSEYGTFGLINRFKAPADTFKSFFTFKTAL
jgi:hypothetical protein